MIDYKNDDEDEKGRYLRNLEKKKLNKLNTKNDELTVENERLKERLKNESRLTLVIKEGTSSLWVGTKNFLKECRSPQFLLTVIGTFAIYNEARESRKSLETQHTQLIQIEQDVNKRPLQNLIKKNWRKASAAGITVVLGGGKLVYNNWATTRDLRSALHQAQGQIHDTQGEVTTAQQEKEVAKQETVVAKQETEAVKKEAQVREKKFKTTLVRLNSSAQKAGATETELRDIILEQKAELQDLNRSRKEHESSALRYKDLFEEEKENTESLRNDVNTLQSQVNRKVSETKTLQNRLEYATKNEGMRSPETRKLQRELKKATDTTNKLTDKLSESKQLLRRSTREKKELHDKLTNAKKELAKAKRNIVRHEKIKATKEEYLQEAMGNTIDVAEKMDATKAAFEEYERNNKQSPAERIEMINNKFKYEKTILEQKTKQLNARETTIRELKKFIGNDQELMTANMEENSVLNKEIEQDKKALKNASQEEKYELKQKIRQNINRKRALETNNESLQERIDKHDEDLVQALSEKQKIINEKNSLQAQFSLENKSFVEALQAERQNEENRYKKLGETCNTVANNLLGQQEIDQEKSWLEKIQIKIAPELSVRRKKDKEKEKEVKTIFYSGWSTEIPAGRMTVNEKYSNKTKKLERVDKTPRRAKISQYFSK